MVNIDFINSNVNSPGIIANLETSSYQNCANIFYKTDMGSSSKFYHFVNTKFCSVDQKTNYCHESRVKTPS